MNIQHTSDVSKIVTLSLYQAVETYTVLRRRGSHIFYTIASQMAFCGYQPYVPAAFYPPPPGRFLVIISVTA
jgi:hypothetical protein